ncbi:MAG TPA: sialidase family protein [Noviherbaspirillum sp.]
MKQSHALSPSRIAVAIFFQTLASCALAGALTWQGSTEIAVGRGERGPWQQNESRFDYVDDPTVVIDDDGRLGVAWVEQARKDVFFLRLSPEGETPRAQPVNVSRSPQTFSWLPRASLAPDDPKMVYVLWQEIIFSGGSHGGDILFARSADFGKSFSNPVNLSRSVGGDGKGRINKDVWHNGSLDLVSGRSGALYAAWTEYDGLLWLARSTDGGKTFSAPQHLAGGGAARPVRGPTLAVGPGKTVYLAWTTGEDNAADIHLMQSTDGGASFSEPRIVAKTDGYSDAPKLAVDRSGVVHLAFAESSGGPFARYRIRTMRSEDRGRTFTAMQELPLPATDSGAAFPSLALDGKGRMMLMWERYRGREQRPRGLAIAVSTDGGRSFTPPEIVPESSDPAGGSNGSHQGLLMEKLDVNAAGEFAIVNSSLVQDERSRVWVIRGRIAP